MAVAERAKTDRIRELNDEFRQSFIGGRVMLTSGVDELADDVKAKVLQAVRTFDALDGGNDPYHEHDFLSVEIDGGRFFAKVDYYDKELKYGSEDPSDPQQTIRVLTITRADEY